MVSLKEKLSGRTVIMGVGNLLKSDDALGPLVIGELNRRGFAKYPLIDAGTTPENYLGKIAKLRPDLLLIVDAADFGAAAGQTALFKPEEILLRGFSTHELSLKTFAAALTKTLPGLAILVLGVQPAALGFGEELSPPVGRALDEIVSQLLAL